MPVSAARVAVAHKVAELTGLPMDFDPRGDDGEKLEALHSCHNGGNDVDCVNPAHIRWGTRQENEDDKKLRGHA